MGAIVRENDDHNGGDHDCGHGWAMAVVIRHVDSDYSYLPPCTCTPRLWPRGSTLVEPHVTSSITTRTTFEAPPEHSIWTIWAHWADHIFLTSQNPFWYVRLWVSNTGVTNGTFPILTSTSMDHHAQSHTVNRLKRRQTASWRTAWHNHLAIVMIVLSLTAQPSL